jgi:hypothetical protein
VPQRDEPDIKTNDTFAERSECSVRRIHSAERGFRPGLRFFIQIAKIGVHNFLQQLLISIVEFRAGLGFVHVRGDGESRR